jgi:hypothetical protein
MRIIELFRDISDSLFLNQNKLFVKDIKNDLDELSYMLKKAIPYIGNKDYDGLKYIEELYLKKKKKFMHLINYL